MSDVAGRDGTPPNTQLKGGDLGRFGCAGDDSQDADYPLGGNAGEYDVLSFCDNSYHAVNW